MGDSRLCKTCARGLYREKGAMYPRIYDYIHCHHDKDRDVCSSCSRPENWSKVVFEWRYKGSDVVSIAKYCPECGRELEGR
jgi:hypothetical protein